MSTTRIVQWLKVALYLNILRREYGITGKEKSRLSSGFLDVMKMKLLRRHFNYGKFLPDVLLRTTEKINLSSIFKKYRKNGFLDSCNETNTDKYNSVTS